MTTTIIPTKQLTLIRAVSQQECWWLAAALPTGLVVYAYRGCTYGCISDGGIAVTAVDGETPFFEIPESAV